MRVINADVLFSILDDRIKEAEEDARHAKRDVVAERADAVLSTLESFKADIEDKALTIDAVPATIEGTLGYLHKVGWMQEHDRIMTEDAVPVVRCKDCKWWTKQEKSIQGRCALHGIYPTGGWYCGNGERKDDE